MNTMKRFFAVCLCLAMLFSLAGCSKESSKEDQQQTKDYVYTTEFKSLNNTDYMDSVVLQGNKVYYNSWSYDEAAQTGGYATYVVDLDTLEKTVLPISLDENENIANMAVKEDGSMTLLTNMWNENGNSSYFIVSLDASGNETARKDITAPLSQGSDPEFGVYPQSVETDKEGNLYILVSGQNEIIMVFDTQGQKLFEISSDSWFQGLCSSSDGRVFAMSYDYESTGNNYMLQQIDLKTKSFGDTFKGIPGGNGNMQCVGGGENEILVSSGNILYKYDLNSQTCEELLNWINCDINSDSLRTFVQLEDGRILAFIYDWNSTDENSRSEVVYLTKTPASEVKQKTVLTYGTMWLDSDIRTQIINFNKTNDIFRIEVKEYGTGDYDAGRTQLNSDIVSGNGPDIIDLNGDDISTYISKGVLTDLYALMEKDPDVKKEDFVPNVLKAYEKDGKLYGISASFSISTLMGKTSDVGDQLGWTVADVQKLMASKPEGTELMEYASRESILQMLVIMGAESYVDWENGTCSFDSDDFIQLLEFAGTFPSAENIDYNYDEGTYTKISQGKLILSSVYISDVMDYLSQAAMFGGEPVTCVGYPTPDGSGSILNTNMTLGISEKSQNKEGAWAFIKTILSEEFQDSLSWNFPIRESSLQKVFDKAMIEDENQGTWGWNDFTFEGRAATAEEIAAIRELIDNAQGTISYNEEISTIINEEAAPYFAGQKSAKEAADIIQSRVRIYVSENS